MFRRRAPALVESLKSQRRGRARFLIKSPSACDDIHRIALDDPIEALTRAKLQAQAEHCGRRSHSEPLLPPADCAYQRGATNLHYNTCAFVAMQAARQTNITLVDAWTGLPILQLGKITGVPRSRRDVLQVEAMERARSVVFAPPGRTCAPLSGCISCTVRPFFCSTCTH